MYADEPPDGSYVLATYRTDCDDVEKVWQRIDRNGGQEHGDWWEVRGGRAWCTYCGTTRELGPTGPDSWGVVCGLDDPEPYGVSQVLLWLDDECEPWAALESFARWLVSLDNPDPASAGFQERRAVTLIRIIDRARQALGEKE
jgi:hypothetical protein